MKKRLLVLLMALAMCFAMFGCNGNDEAQPEGTEDAPVDVQPEDENTPEDETQPKDETQPEENAPENEAQPE